jgi:hypothetical protein
MSRKLQHAVKIASELQDWLNHATTASMIPTAGVTWTTETLSIFIGDITVWDDDNYPEEDFTFEACLQSWSAEIGQFAPFIDAMV